MAHQRKARAGYFRDCGFVADIHPNLLETCAKGPKKLRKECNKASEELKEKMCLIKYRHRL